jgi:hypothetical protein
MRAVAIKKGQSREKAVGLQEMGTVRRQEASRLNRTAPLIKEGTASVQYLSNTNQFALVPGSICITFSMCEHYRLSRRNQLFE